VGSDWDQSGIGAGSLERDRSGIVGAGSEQDRSRFAWDMHDIRRDLCGNLPTASHASRRAHQIPPIRIHSASHSCSQHGPHDELFTVGTDGGREHVIWPDRRFPFLLVNMGSGVSVCMQSARSTQSVRSTQHQPDSAVHASS
jgi:hypothetical protein